MKEVKKVKVEVEQEKIIALICNKCGKRVEMEDRDNWEEINLMHSFDVGFGFGSNYDLETWEFILCESCLLEFVKTFAIPPTRIGCGC